MGKTYYNKLKWRPITLFLGYSGTLPPKPLKDYTLHLENNGSFVTPPTAMMSPLLLAAFLLPDIWPPLL